MKVMFFAQETTEVLYTTDPTTVTTVNATPFIFFSGVWAFVWLLVLVVGIVAGWKIFSKAGQAGWKILIPIYNLYIIMKIVGRPGWWVILFFIPIVHIVVTIIVAIDLARSFGKSEVFGVVGLWLFSLIGALILAFGSAKYGGPSVKAKA